jgi:hypothetical protein
MLRQSGEGLARAGSPLPIPPHQERGSYSGGACAFCCPRAQETIARLTKRKGLDAVLADALRAPRAFAAPIPLVSEGEVWRESCGS